MIAISHHTSSLIDRAVEALDLMNACIHHKLPAIAAKRKALSELLQNAADTYRNICAQSGLQFQLFDELVSARLNTLRATRARIAKEREIRREQARVERERFLASLGQ